MLTTKWKFSNVARRRAIRGVAGRPVLVPLLVLAPLAVVLFAGTIWGTSTASSQVQESGPLCFNQVPTIVGTSGDDILTGTDDVDVIVGLGGDDIIWGDSGNDYICGGGGDDVIRGDEGDDIILGDDGNDKIHGGAGQDFLSGRAGDDRISGGSGSDDVRGDRGNDLLYGMSGFDIVNGGPGVDEVWGGSEDDLLLGGTGPDILRGGGGNDELDGEEGQDQLHGGVGDDDVSGSGQSDYLNGGPGHDTLLGGPGRDLVVGGDGDDIVRGDAGQDQLHGGDGDDFLRDGAHCFGDDGENSSRDCAWSDRVNDPPAPKIILFAMLDDADYFDFGYAGADAQTPNIDRVAANGVQLSDYYAGSGICSPTRLSVMTGDAPSAHGLSRLWPDSGPLPSSAQLPAGLKGLRNDQTLLTDLSHAGYRTAHFGKWHLGDSNEGHGIADAGFDEYRYVKVNPFDVNGNSLPSLSISEDDWNSRNFVLRVDTEEGRNNHPGAWRPEYLADEIIELIDSLGPNDRVFINWWTIVPHTPIRTPPGFDNSETQFDLSTQRGQLLAMMHDWDFHFGRVLDHIENSGDSEDSLVMVTSDNGGLRTALAADRGLSGAKSSLQEGGIRVPFTAQWPGTIPAGSQSSTPMSSTDLLPTLFSLTGLPSNVTGQDMSEVLRGGEIDREAPLHWNMRTRSTAVNNPERTNDSVAMRQGCMKYIYDGETGTGHLYDVCEDPAESADLAVIERDIFNAMEQTAFENRTSSSLIDIIPSEVSRPVQLPDDERFNIYNQDFTFTASFVPTENSVQRLLQAPGLTITSDGDSVIATLRGSPSDEATVRTRLVERSLEASFDSTGDVTVQLVLHGAMRGYTTASLYVDHELKATLSGTDSVFALESGPAEVIVGDDDLTLENVSAHTLAITGEQLENLAESSGS